MNIGIVYRDTLGRRRFAKGPYRKRLAAFVPELTIQRAIDAEIQQLERNLERSGEIEESRHIVKARKSTLVHRENRGWMDQVLEQMVPNYSGSTG